MIDLAELRRRAEAATPGKWFANYSGVYSADLVWADDEFEWPDAPDGSPEMKAAEWTHYHTVDSRIASVPASHGDTPTGRHNADVLFIEAFDPPTVLALLDMIEGK